jgi:hypothetical protein
MNFETSNFFNKNITTPLYKSNSKFSSWENNKNKYKEEVYNKPIIYSDDVDCKTVEDYGEFVKNNC